MSEKFNGGILPNSEDVSIQFILRSSTDNSEVTGKVAADLTMSYWRQGASRTAITPSDLSAIDADHVDGGIIEVDATNMPGLYRLDLPDAIAIQDADWAVISVKCTGTYIFFERFAIDSKPIIRGGGGGGQCAWWDKDLKLATDFFKAFPSKFDEIISKFDKISSNIAKMDSDTSVNDSITSSNKSTATEIISVKNSVKLLSDEIQSLSKELKTTDSLLLSMADASSLEDLLNGSE